MSRRSTRCGPRGVKITDETACMRHGKKARAGLQSQRGRWMTCRLQLHLKRTAPLPGISELGGAAKVWDGGI